MVSVGLTPRICEGLFSREDDYLKQPASCRVEVSFLEIYNERVRDLLRPSTHEKPYTLRVREHPETGPYVQGLSQHVVTDYHQVVRLLEEGVANRITAVTHVHDASSRSHAIFTIQYTQATLENNLPSEIASKINLVDLAGSERADPSYCKDRITEGANINKSLVTLGIVISALAQNSQMISSCQSISSIASDVDSAHTGSPCGAGQRRQAYIPYRDSILTWLLKDSLGGNSKTIMIATISPASSCYNETMNTLRYASNAKNIVNKPRVNEDANVKLIRELREEIDRLKAMLMSFELRNFSPSWSDDKDGNLTELVLQNELKIEQLTKDWTDKWINKKAIMEEYRVDINKKKSGVAIDSSLPHLMTMDEDILSTGVVLYHLREGTTKIGRCDSNQEQDIVLQGEWIEKDHCIVENQRGVVTLQPLQGAHCLVNGHKVTDSFRLSQGALVVLGKAHKFRFNHPAEAAILRQRRSISETSSTVLYRSLEWLNLDGDFTPLLSCNLYPGEKESSKQVDTSREECQPKEKNKDFRRSRKLQKQLLYVEELQQQILDGKIKAEQELEHDQAVINQQIRENQQLLIKEQKRLSVQQQQQPQQQQQQQQQQKQQQKQQQESAVQTEVKSYVEAGVQNILELEICPSLQNKRKLVQVELLQKYSLKKAERDLRRKKLKLHLERIVKKQKLLEAKKNLEHLEASCWSSEDKVKHSHPLYQRTSWDCKDSRPGQSSDASSVQRRRNSFLNIQLPHVPSCCVFLKGDTYNELSTSAHNYRCSQVSLLKKSLSVGCLPRTIKERSRTDNIGVEIDDSFPTQRQLAEIYKSLCLPNEQRLGNSIRNTHIISHIFEDCNQMEKTDNRLRQTRPKSQISKNCSPDLFKKKSELESRKLTKTKAAGDNSQCIGKHLEKNGTQEISKKQEKYVRNNHQSSLPASSIKELKRSTACGKLPVQHLSQTAKNVKRDPKDRQSKEGCELLRLATSTGNLNKIKNKRPLCPSEKRWHSAEVLSVGISKIAPDPLRSWQEDEDIEFSDTDSTYSVDSLSCIYTTVLTEQITQEESAGIQDTLDLEDSESVDSQMSQDSLTEKVNKPESQDQKFFPLIHQEPMNFNKDNNYQPLLILASTSTSGSNLTEHERSFSLDSLSDVDEVSEDMAEKCTFESFDEVPAELLGGLQNPQLEIRNRNEQHNPENCDENIIKKSDDLNVNASSFYLDSRPQSGASSICDQSLKKMKINFSVQRSSVDQRPHAAGENLPISSDAWLSYSLKSGESNPIVVMPSSQDHSDFQVAQMHPFNTSHNRMKKDELRQSAAELSFVSYKKPHRISHEPNKIEMLFSAPPSTPLPETRRHLERGTVGAAVTVFSSAADILFDHVSAFPANHGYCEIAPPPESNHQPDELANDGSSDKWKETSSCLKETSGNLSQTSEKQHFSVPSIYPENNEDSKNNSLISTSSTPSLQGEEPHITTNLEDNVFRTIEKEGIDYDSDCSIGDSKVVYSNTEDKFICTLPSGPPRLATMDATQEKHQGYENLFSKEKTSLFSNEHFYLCDISESQNHVEEEEYSDKMHLLKHDGCHFDPPQIISYQQVLTADPSVDSSSENKLYQMKTGIFHHNDQFTPLLQTSAIETATMHENRDVLTESALEVPAFREVKENKLQDEEWSSENHFEFQTEALLSRSYSCFLAQGSENCSRQKQLLNLDAGHLMGKSSEGKNYNVTCMDLMTDSVERFNVNVNEKKAELSVLNSCSADDQVSSQSNPNMLCKKTPKEQKDVCETRSPYTENNSKDSCSGSVISTDGKYTMHTFPDNSVKFGCTGKTKVRHRSLPSSREVKEASLLCVDLKRNDCSGVEFCTTQPRNYAEKNSVNVLENRVFSATTSQAQTPCANKESEYLKEKVVTSGVTVSGENKSEQNSKSVCSEELTKLINSINKLENDILEIKSSKGRSLHNYLGIESQSDPIMNRKNSESSSPFHRPSHDHGNGERRLLGTVTQEETNAEKIQLNDDSEGELGATKAATGPDITFQSSNINENKSEENTQESDCHTTDMKAGSERIDSAVCNLTVLTKTAVNFLDEYDEPVQADRVIKTVCTSVPTVMSVPTENVQEDTSEDTEEHKKMPPNHECKSCLTESLTSPKVVFQENKVDGNIINFETEDKESETSEKETLIGLHTAENHDLVQEKQAYDHMYGASANDDEIPEKYFVASVLEEEDGLQLPVTCLDADEVHQERSHGDVTNKFLKNNCNAGSLCEDRDVIGQCKISQSDNFENINVSTTSIGNGPEVLKSVPNHFIPKKKEETPMQLTITELLTQSPQTQSMHLFTTGEDDRYFRENSEGKELETSQNQGEVLLQNKYSYCFSNKETLFSEVSEASELFSHIFSKNKGDIGDDSINVNQKYLPESRNQDYRVTAVAVKDLFCHPAHHPLLNGKNRSGENAQGDPTDANNSGVPFRYTGNVADLQYYETQMDVGIQAGSLPTKAKRDNSEVVMQNKYINFPHDLPEQDIEMKAGIRFKKSSNYIASDQVPGEDNPCSKSCVPEHRASLAFASADDTGSETVLLTKLLSENTSHDLENSNEKHGAREDQKPEHYLHSIKNISPKESAVLDSFGSRTTNMLSSVMFKENADEIMQNLPELSSQEDFNSINSQKALDSVLEHNQTNKYLQNTNCTESEHKTNSVRIMGELGCQAKNNKTLVYGSSCDLCGRNSEEASEGGEELLQPSTQVLWENANHCDDRYAKCNMNSYVSEYSASRLNSSDTLSEYPIDKYEADGLYFGEREYMNSKVLDVTGDYDVHEEYGKIISKTESSQEIMEMHQKEKQQENSFLESLGNKENQSENEVDRTEISLLERSLFTHQSLEKISNYEAMQTHLCSLKDFPMCTEFKNASIPRSSDEFTSSICMHYADSLKDSFLTYHSSSAFQVPEGQVVCHQAFPKVSCSSSGSLSECENKTLHAASSYFPELATNQMQESQCSDTVISGRQPCTLETASSSQRSTSLDDSEIHKSELEKNHHEADVFQELKVKVPRQTCLENIAPNLYPPSYSCSGSQRDQSIYFSSRVDIVDTSTSEANIDHMNECKLMNKEREFLMSEQLNHSVINGNMSSKYVSANSNLPLQKELEQEIFRKKILALTAQNANIGKDDKQLGLKSHSLSAPAIAIMSNFDCASETLSKIDCSEHLVSKSLQELNMSVEPPSPTENDAHRTESFLKFKADNVVPVKYKPRFQKKSVQAQRSSNYDKRNWREQCQSSHSSDLSPVLCPTAVDHTTHSPMDTQEGNHSNNVPLVYGHNMDRKETRYQMKATGELLPDNKDTMHFSSSDIDPYIHSWQQDEHCKIGWKQYVFGSASDVSSNLPPWSLDTQSFMRCSSVDNGLNTENSFHSHLSSYANARILSSTISSTDDIQGWEATREGFESAHSDESSKHYVDVSHDETTPENCVLKCENLSQQSGNSSMQVDEIVLLYPSESDVLSSKSEGLLTCERETQTEPPAKLKRQKRHRRSYTDVSSRKPEGVQSSFQQPSSWSSVQNLSMHLSQLLHNTSELLGNFSLHTVKDNEQSVQKTPDKKSVKAEVSDSYTQTTEDIGIQTDNLQDPQHKNKENQIKPKMESEPVKSQEVNVIVKVVHTDTVALMKENISENKGLVPQSMPDLRSHDNNKTLNESRVPQGTLNKDFSPSLEEQKIPLDATQTVTLGHPQASLATSFHSQHDETSHSVVSIPSSTIPLSSAYCSQDRKPVGKPGIPESRELYCKNSLFVDRASSPILTLSASTISTQHSLNKATPFKSSVGNQRDIANLLNNFRKRESGSPYDLGSLDLHVDTSSQTDSESTTSRDSKEICKKSENVLEKNTVKEPPGIGSLKQKHRFTIDTHTAIHTKRLYHSSSTLELSNHGEYLLDDHRETMPGKHSFHQTCATRRARNFSGGIKYGSPIGNSESSPIKMSFQVPLNELNMSSSLKSAESPEYLLDSFSPLCHRTWRNNKSYPGSTSEMSELQGDDMADEESDVESKCNTEILLNENTSSVKTHRLRSYSLRDLPVHNKFSNWCGVKGGPHSSLTSLTQSTGDIQSPAERRTVNTRATEVQDQSLLGERRAREIERLQRERAQVMSGVHLDMNHPPLTVELTEAKLTYGIGETDAQLRILQGGAAENLTSVPTKQQLYQRHRTSIEILRKQREERLQNLRRSRSLSPQKHLSLLQSGDMNQRDSDLPSQHCEDLQQLRKDVVKNTRVHEPKMRIQHPSEIELLLRDYQRAREETKTEIARARDKLRERAEQEKRRIQEQMFPHQQKEEMKLKTLVSTSTLCTDSTLSLSSGPTSGYNSSNTATYAASILGKQEEQASEDVEHTRGRSAIRNHQVYILEHLQKDSTNETVPTTPSCIEKSGIQSPLPASHRFFHSVLVSPTTFPASPMKGYEDLSKYVLANATAEVMAVCSNDLRNLYSGQATAGWKYQCMEKDVLVYYKAFSSSATKHGFLGAGVIDRPLPTVLCMLKDPSKRHLYDKTITTAQVHKKITSSIELVYVVSDISLCYQKQPRDFCCISVEAKEDNVSILAIQSVYEESMPRPCKEMVRGEILPSAWILEPDTLNGRDITKVIYMVQVDLGAPAIPASLLSSVAKRQPLVIARLAHFLAG
ncbi:stAR-related lipid transfer protein 9 isoform X2 [Sphaerodactylus townsendi]|uniref:stAR-related lipid transfer protein 9 isoform X2 n=1 Tax=Sphaerodactylus townsendi TaxID=933632 RepID=UPI002027267C|nr:stAR-related lipid transfer protein 9 isoform X2 [Sphaerodactylus townsendi]